MLSQVVLEKRPLKECRVYYYMALWVPLSPYTKLQFSSFRAHGCYQQTQTDRHTHEHTDHATSVTIGFILCYIIVL